MSKHFKKKHKHKMSNVQKVEVVLSYILRASLVFAIVWAALHAQWFVVFIGALTLVTSFLPNLLEKSLKISLPIEFELLVIVFLYAAMFLGEAANFYYTIWWWDIMLHGVASIALGFVGFLILYTLLYQGRIRTSAFILCIYAFGFALALATLWEIFEFLMDQTLGLDMQKSGLVDTMTDLIVGAGGALFTSLIGFYYVQHQGKHSRVLRYLIGKYYEENHIKPSN